ncbi:MAG: cation-transporting P-type ATPase, partial [Cycloclasticus sp.]
MTVRAVVTSEHLFELTGTGYDPHGEILLSTKSVPDNETPLLLDTLRAGVLCNEATLDKREGDWRVHGDPMEGALLVAGLKAGIDIDIETKQYPLTDLIPFES